MVTTLILSTLSFLYSNAFSYSASTRTFCNNAVGELHRQYCEVMDVYCGITMRVLQYAMSVMCGIALLIAIWTIFLVFSSHRSIIDIYLMQLCIFNGIGYLGIACLWYLTVYRAIISTTFYKDQYVRCLENPSSRKCWHIGSCLYVMGSSTFLYPILSMLTASYVGVKFRNYQHRLRNLLEQITTVELPAPSMAMKSQTQQRPHDHAISKSKATSNEHHVTTLLTSNAGMEIDMAAIQLQSGNKLASLEHIPSTMSAINVNDLDRVVLSDGEEKEENDRSEITARVSSPRSLKKKKSKRRKK